MDMHLQYDLYCMACDVFHITHFECDDSTRPCKTFKDFVECYPEGFDIEHCRVDIPTTTFPF